MFRMEVVELGPEMTLRIEGRFVGHFAEEAKLLVTRQKAPAGLKVDISELTYVDANGEEALTWLGQIGAKFVAERSYALDVCERLDLALARNGNGHQLDKRKRRQNGS